MVVTIGRKKKSPERGENPLPLDEHFSTLGKFGNLFCGPGENGTCHEKKEGPARRGMVQYKSAKLAFEGVAFPSKKGKNPAGPPKKKAPRHSEAAFQSPKNINRGALSEDSGALPS